MRRLIIRDRLGIAQIRLSAPQEKDIVVEDQDFSIKFVRWDVKVPIPVSQLPRLVKWCNAAIAERRKKK